MKKIIYLIGIASVLFAGCQKIERNYLTFEKVVSADFELLLEKAGDKSPNF